MKKKLIAFGFCFASSLFGQTFTADIHTHLEATAGSALLMELATVNNVTLPANAFDFQQTYLFEGLPPFLNAYYQTMAVITKASDYFKITQNFLRQLKAQNTIYSEFIVCPDCAEMAGIPWQNMMEQVTAAIEAEQVNGKFYARMQMTFIRGKTTGAQALNYVQEVLKDRKKLPWKQLVVGIHLSGDELGFPDVTPYSDAYAAAGKGGLGLSVHVGETGPAESIVTAVNALNVTRIGHGIAAAQSQDVMNFLSARNITLEVCPTSNKCTQAQNVTTYVNHPFKTLLDNGLLVTLNADDPLFFAQTTTRQELDIMTQTFGLSPNTQIEIVRNTIRGSFAPEDIKKELLALIDGEQVTPSEEF